MENERPDHFREAMSILIAAVALVTAIAAWRAADAARTAGFQDYFALTATLNRIQAETLATAEAIAHLTAFTQFAINDELETQLLETDVENLTTAQQAVLDAELEQAARLAATNRNFFPSRYANRDGTYALPREIAERIADAEHRQDLNPQPHLERSNLQDAKTFSFIQVIILSSAALLFLTLAAAFHAERAWLRRSAALAGILCLIVSIGNILFLEFR